MALSKLFVCMLIHFTVSLAKRDLGQVVDNQVQLLSYHNGSLLSGDVAVNLIWYGKFKASQKAVITDFITSLSSSKGQAEPSVATWWKATDKYYPNGRGKQTLSLRLGKQVADDECSLGRSLTDSHLKLLAASSGQETAVNVVLTSSDVTVVGFCMNRCGTHGSSIGSSKAVGGGKAVKSLYIWVGNSETQCPGYCAWPFHQPIYGPQSPPLVAPNADVALDGMIINLGTLLAGTVTNPFGNGYYQGPKEAPLEAASACPGVYGKGAYPGYAGNLLIDPSTGASYNANGNNGRKYLLPALYDPSTSTCSTLV